MEIAVAGGTGLVGRMVVQEAQAAGHHAVVLSRSTGVDVTTGRGLAAALAGAEALVDVSNTSTMSREKATAFFTAGTAHLVQAGRGAGIRHHVLLSIVGVDRVPMGYYQGHLAQEEALLASGAPATVQRATQFHEFPAQLLGRIPGPVLPVPRMRSQPVAAREVARRLLELAVGEPAGRVPDLAGPEVHDMADLVRRTLAAQHRRRAVLSLRLPGGAARASAGTGLLPTGPGPRGEQTFTQWLAGPDAAALLGPAPRQS